MPIPEYFVASREAVLQYNDAPMIDPPDDYGTIKILEEPVIQRRRQPEFVADMSGRGLTVNLGADLHIHGSYLVRRTDVLLFGPNNILTKNGYWSCEARSFKRQFLWYLHLPFYDRMYPGPKPRIEYQTDHLRCDTTDLAKSGSVVQIEEPVFLATPLEPPIWGRWLNTVTPKIFNYKKYGTKRRFLCHTELAWEKAFLETMGIPSHMIIPHDPGRTYLCRDLMTVEYSITNATISACEQANFFELVVQHKKRVDVPKKLFVARLTRSRHNPHYRVLQNELALAKLLLELGFSVIEPEFLSLELQISLFAGAEQIVFVGGSAVFNAVFCAPGTSVVTIEASDTYIGAHTSLFASLGLRYGVIFGEEDPNDPAEHHRRWHLDISRTRAALLSFFS